MGRRLAVFAALLIALSLQGQAAVEASAAPVLPGWETLEFEQQAMWVTARSKLRLRACPESSNPGLWCLQTSSSVASNSEELSIQFNPDDGALHLRSRLSQGRSQRRLKIWQYTDEYILRERRNPVGEPSINQAEWPLTARSEIPYPAGESRITDSNLLLLLASPGRAGDGQSEYIVQTDFNFYRVSRRQLGSGSLLAAYRVEGNDEVLSDERPVQLVELSAQPLGKLSEKPDFNILGLSGTVTIAYDSENDLPLQLTGRAPRIGKTRIKLMAVSPRNAPQ